jgi:membrane protease YdiL (CAAX protease family)
MSVAAARLPIHDGLGIGAILAPASVVVALAGVVAARWAATRAGLDALAVGAAFGLALVMLAALAGARTRHTRTDTTTRWIARPLAIGLVAGLAVVAVAELGPILTGATTIPGLGRPASPFLPWAVIRGVLFERVERLGGVGGALIVTTIAFALLHVPLYGWHVVPLDLGVGLLLGGLRVVTRSVVAPAAAHVVADLAAWWL